MFGFAKKIGMTRIFIDEKSVPVTALEVDKNHVVQIKTQDKDGYNAVQIGSFPKKTKSPKARTGHVKKQADLDHDFYCLEEFRDIELGEDKKVFDINDVTEDLLLDVTGRTIGRGFTGAVKRWGFAGQPASHGHDHKRAVGSIGARWPQRVGKGKKMAGHHGDSTKTIRKMKVVGVDAENNLFFVEGSVPGANSSYVKIKKVK